MSRRSGQYGRPERILLSNRHHLRHSTKFAESFGCSIHCHEAGLHEFRDGPDVHGFRFGEEIAPGDPRASRWARSRRRTRSSTSAAGRGALLFADGLIRGDGGSLEFVPDKLMGDDPEEVQARPARLSLRALVDQDFDALLFAHGEPMVSGGREALRRLRRLSGAGATLRLDLLRPYPATTVLGLAFEARTMPGVEERAGPVFRRTLQLARRPRDRHARAACRPHNRATLDRVDPGDEDDAVAVCRRLLDLDADPREPAGVLGADPVLAPLLGPAPGIRVPGTVDGFEAAARAVLGQGVSLAAARALAGRLVHERAEASRCPRRPAR